MIRTIETPRSSEQREIVSRWGQKNVDLRGVAERIREEIEAIA